MSKRTLLIIFVFVASIVFAVIGLVLVMKKNDITQGASKQVLNTKEVTSGGSIIDFAGENKTDLDAAGLKALSAASVSMLLCMGTGEFIDEPQNGKTMCRNTTFKWPDIAAYNLTWGGCQFDVKRALYGSVDDPVSSNQIFYTFCATADSGQVFKCNNLEPYCTTRRQ